MDMRTFIAILCYAVICTHHSRLLLCESPGSLSNHRKGFRQVFRTVRGCEYTKLIGWQLSSLSFQWFTWERDEYQTFVQRVTHPNNFTYNRV